jgi:hypothetical protein
MTRLLFCIAFVFALLATGCPPENPLGTNATGDAITRADVRNKSVTQQVDLAKPHSDSEGKVHLDTASIDLKAQSSDLAEAKTALKVERENCAKTYDALTKLNTKWYVRWGRRIERICYLLIGVLGLGVVLRTASQFIVGPVGTAMAFASTGIFGVMSGGISLIQSGFDNLWFRGKANVGVARGG